MDEAEIWRLVGPEGFRTLVAAFYRRVRNDDLIGPLYPPEDLEGAERRLREFLCFRFGNEPAYLLERGHPRLRLRHLHFAIGPAERDRWLELMDESMVESELPRAARAPLQVFFTGVADFMRNQ